MFPFRLPNGYLILSFILFILSFPPVSVLLLILSVYTLIYHIKLFGQEIVAIVAGVVYGVGYGFLIVAAGTTLGEIANF